MDMSVMAATWQSLASPIDAGGKAPKRSGVIHSVMVPGFVLLGSVAVMGQLLVIGGFYWYLQRRRPLTESAVRQRVCRLVLGGMALVGLGQFLALGSIGSLRMAAILTFRQALLLQEGGLVGALLGYLLVIAGFVIHARRTA